MIELLSLQNFKCFEDISLPFAKVNILTGLNGMGKSSVIQALLLLKQSFEAGTGDVVRLNGPYVDLGWGRDVLFEKAASEFIDISVRTDVNTYAVKCGYVPEEDQLPITEKTASDLDFGDWGRRLFYLSAYRIAPQHQYRLTNRKDLSARQFWPSGEFSVQYLNAFGSSLIGHQHMMLGTEDQNSLLQQASLWMSYISPGTTIQVNVDDTIKTSELRYSFIEGPNRTAPYRCANVGFGLTYVLPIIVLLLSAQKGDTILLENPEAHIHPAGQSKLGELIAKAGADGIQVIVETHSDHILNGIRLAVKNRVLTPDDVYPLFFYKDADDRHQHKVMLPKIDSEGRIDQWPKGFFDEWNNMLFQLL